MADNPFAQYAAPATASDNPFAQFAEGTSTRQPAFEGSKAHLIPGAESDIMPTPRKGFLEGKGIIGGAKDIVKGAVEVPALMAYNLATLPIATVATGGKPEQWVGARAPQTETAQRVLGGVAETAEGLKAPALTPGMLVATGGNLVNPAIRQGAGIANRLAAPVIETGINKLAPIVEQIKAPMEARKERIAAEKSAESYRRAPQIEAAKDLVDMGFSVNPASSNPTIKNQIMQRLGGRSNINENAAEVNRTPTHDTLVRVMGLDPEETTLTEPFFKKALDKASPAYNAVKDVELFKADKSVEKQIAELRRDPALIADKALEGELNKMVDSALGRVGKGLTGEELLKNVSDLRARAKTLRNSTSVTPKDVEIADTYMGIAKALEEMIDSNVNDPKMLSNYQKARETMAQIYQVQDITDLASGTPDVFELARLAAKPNALTGDLAKLAKGVANFPESFKATPPGVGEFTGTAFTRAGIPGTVGALLGEATGAGWLTGGAIGSTLGYLGGKALAKRAVGRGYQAANAVPQDFRIMPNQLATQVNQTQGVPAVYDWRNALNQGQPSEQPNWVPGREAPAVEIPRIAAPSAEAELGRVQQQRQFQYGQEAAADVRAAQAAEAQAAASRAPASGGQLYDLDPITGRLRPVDQGLKGATPDVIRDTGVNLASASEKVAAGQRGLMSAAEKIAWDRTKVDLAEIASGFEKLSDKAIAEKMMDRAWAEQAVQKARDQARAFDEIAARAADERTRQQAIASRERMMDLAEMLDERMRNIKPRVTKHQGPKTREAKRNALIGDTDVNKLNALVQ